MPRNRIVAVASNEDHRRRLRITGVSVIALAALLLIAQAALAHSAFGSMGPSGNWNGCELEYESTHDATSYSAVSDAAAHSEASGDCAGMNVEVYYYTGSSWDLDYDTDTLGPPFIAAVNGSHHGVSYSDHNARPTGAGYWIGGRIWH